MSPTPPNAVVRAAKPEEAAYVAWLAALTFPLACPPGTVRADVAAHVSQNLTPGRFRHYATSSVHSLLVASADGTPESEPLGYSLLQLGRPAGQAEASVLVQATGSAGPFVELSKIYVHPRVIGTVVASNLMRASVAAADQLAASHHHEPLPLWLGTNARNTRARAFYGKHGFVVVGTRTYDVGGQQHDDVVMLRQE